MFQRLKGRWTLADVSGEYERLARSEFHHLATTCIKRTSKCQAALKLTEQLSSLAPFSPVYNLIIFLSVIVLSLSSSAASLLLFRHSQVYFLSFSPLTCGPDRDRLITACPELWSNQGDKPSSRGLRGALTRFRVLTSETNKPKKKKEKKRRRTPGTVWLMCLFGVFSVPNDGAATDQTAGSIFAVGMAPQSHRLNSLLSAPACLCTHLHTDWAPPLPRGLRLPPLGLNDLSPHANAEHNSNLTLICWFYRLGNATIGALSSSPGL